jgi:hypothetical protein
LPSADVGSRNSILTDVWLLSQSDRIAMFYLIGMAMLQEQKLRDGVFSSWAIREATRGSGATKRSIGPAMASKNNAAPTVRILHFESTTVNGVFVSTLYLIAVNTDYEAGGANVK